MDLKKKLGITGLDKNRRQLDYYLQKNTAETHKKYFLLIMQKTVVALDTKTTGISSSNIWIHLRY